MERFDPLFVDWRHLHRVHDLNRFQADRAREDAAGAADAGLDFLKNVIENDDRGDGLGDDAIIARERSPHHRPSQNKDLGFVRVFVAPGKFNQGFDRRANPNPKVTRMGDALPRDRNVPFIDGFVEFDRLVYSIAGRDIDVEDAIFRRELALGDNNAGRVLEHRDFPTLGVEILQGGNAETSIGIMGDHFLIDRNDVTVFLFDAEFGVVAVKNLLEKHHALEDLFRVLKHHSLVGGDVRLTLDAVDQNHLDRGVNRHFDVSRERGTAEADRSAILENIRHIGFGEFGNLFIASLFHRGIHRIFEVIVDLDEIHQFSRTMVVALEAFERAAAGGVDRLVEESRVAHANHLAEVDVVAFLDVDIGFTAPSVVSRDEEVLGKRGLYRRKLTQEFFGILDVLCFLDH